MSKYTIGVDYGTLSGRAVLVGRRHGTCPRVGAPMLGYAAGA